MIKIANASSYNQAELEALDLVDKINDAILFPLIALLMATAFLIFLWGAFEYVKNSDNETGREKGRQHLLYGTIGMLIMLSAYAILSIAAGTFGLQQQLGDSTRENLSPFAVDRSPTPPNRPSGGAGAGQDASGAGQDPRGAGQDASGAGQDPRGAGRDFEVPANLMQRLDNELNSNSATSPENRFTRSGLLQGSFTDDEIDRFVRVGYISQQLGNEFKQLNE